jgi:hypothetical protein
MALASWKNRLKRKVVKSAVTVAKNRFYKKMKLMI